VRVIGTAGHIDHGKSALVRRLTGIDPDRLLEEKRRGMTIDLGFAWFALPDGTPVSVVDVPGHERFIKNMLAGAGGIDVALLVVAADEGVMPQTREHVDILDLLGIRSGVVGLTKCDLVEPEWVDLVSDEVRSLLSKTGLAGAPLVPVSSVTGEGIDALLEALRAALASAPERRNTGSPWLPVDRVFTVSGFGTVVTGTLGGGTFRRGADVEVQPSGLKGRIRSLQTHGQTVDAVTPGDRAALNLAGVERTAVRRGDVVVLPGSMTAVRRFDARVRVLDDSVVGLRHGLRVALHIGSAEAEATLSFLEGEELLAGSEGWVQVRTAEPVVVVPGQRFILRLPAPARTVAGGTALALRPRHRRRDPAALARLEALMSGTLTEGVRAAVIGSRPLRLPDVAAISGHPLDEVRDAIEELEQAGDVARFGEWLLDRDHWLRRVGRLERMLQRYHDAFPMRPGMPLEEARSHLYLDPGQWTEFVRTLSQAGRVRQQSASLALASFAAARAEGAARDAVLVALTTGGYAPPAERDLLAATGATRELLSAMVRDRSIIRIDDGLYFARSVSDELRAWVVETLESGGTVTVAALRDHFGTSRRFAQAFLEFLDGERITRRVGDERVLGSRAHACA
jgi:selenocysteine-specific elongation factor